MTGRWQGDGRQIAILIALVDGIPITRSKDGWYARNLPPPDVRLSDALIVDVMTRGWVEEHDGGLAITESGREAFRKDFDEMRAWAAEIPNIDLF